MTPDEARSRVGQILERLTQRGLTAPPHQPFTLRGGELRAGPHPEYAAHWTVFWKPTRADLRPIDLEEFTVEAAADQIARYRHAGYGDVRRRLDDTLTLFQGDGIWPIEQHSVPDSFLVGVDGISIVKEGHGGGREPSFRIELETDSMPQVVAPGEAPPEPRYVDLTPMEPAEVLVLVKERLKVGKP
jgi:hypothetical protein